MFHISRWALFIGAIFHTQCKGQVYLIPTCSVECLNLAIDGADGCAISDSACFCTSPGSDKLLACVRSYCDAAIVQQFIAGAQWNCEVFGGFVISGAPASATANIETTVLVQASSTIAPSQATAIAVPASSSLTAIMQATTQAGIAVVTGSSSMITQTVFQLATAVTNSASNQATGVAPVGTTGFVTSSQSTNVGAIAGGVVGGVVLILAVLAFVWFMLRKRRPQNAGVSPVITGPVDAMEGGTGGNDGKDDGVVFAKEVKADLPTGIDTAPVSSELHAVEVEEVEHPHRL